MATDREQNLQIAGRSVAQAFLDSERRIAELEAALREIADVANSGFEDAKSSCRSEAKAIALAAKQALNR